MVVKTSIKTAGWVALNWVCMVFGLMADCRDGMMVILMIASMAACVAVRAAKMTAADIAVN